MHSSQIISTLHTQVHPPTSETEIRHPLLMRLEFRMPKAVFDFLVFIYHMLIPQLALCLSIKILDSL